MRRVGRFAALTLAVMVVLAGCASEYETPSLEDMAMIGVIGYDYSGDKNVQVSVSIPVPSSRAKEMTQTYSTVATVTSEAILKLSSMAERTMSLSQLRVVLFSEEYARKVGLGKVMLDLYRNPIVGENVFVAIVKGRAEDVIRGNYQHKPELNTYLNDLLRPRVETAFSSFTTIKDYIFMTTSGICDPNMPYLVKHTEDIFVDKAALFRGDKMIDTMTQREGKLVQAVIGRKRLPRMSFELPADGKKEQIVLDFIWSKGRVRSKGSLEKPELHIKLEYRVTLVGYTGTKRLDNDGEMETLKKQLEGQFKKEALATLKRFQKAGIDPAQLEESFRRHYRGKWSRDIGLKLYQKAGIDVHVDLEIVGFGTID